MIKHLGAYTLELTSQRHPGTSFNKWNLTNKSIKLVFCVPCENLTVNNNELKALK